MSFFDTRLLYTLTFALWWGLLWLVLIAGHIDAYLWPELCLYMGAAILVEALCHIISGPPSWHAPPWSELLERLLLLAIFYLFFTPPYLVLVTLRP